MEKSMKKIILSTFLLLSAQSIAAKCKRIEQCWISAPKCEYREDRGAYMIKAEFKNRHLCDNPYTEQPEVWGFSSGEFYFGKYYEDIDVCRRYAKGHASFTHMCD